MTMNDKIAVITPTWNSSKFLNRCISSVSDQAVSNIRHYIYNDASTDSTGDFLKQFESNPKFCIVHGTENHGQGWGRNVLIKQALTDGCTYIAFLDDDDCWDSNHLKDSLPYLDQHEIVYSKPNFYFEDGNPAVPYNITIPNTFIGKHLLHNNFVWISSVVAKAECFVNVEFDNRLNSIEDYEMWVQQYKLGRKFVYKDTSSISYIIRTGGEAGKSQSKYPIFNSKHRRLEKIKLNLGCGTDYRDDCINIDLFPTEDIKIDACFDVSSLPYDDSTVDEIIALHVIEHFDFHQSKQVLDEWYRVLKPNGKLTIETPDFLENCKAFVEGPEERRWMLYNHFFESPWIPGQGHKFLFTETQLTGQLNWSKFRQATRIKPISKHTSTTESRLLLAMEAIK